MQLKSISKDNLKLSVLDVFLEKKKNVEIYDFKRHIYASTSISTFLCIGLLFLYLLYILKSFFVWKQHW